MSAPPKLCCTSAREPGVARLLDGDLLSARFGSVIGVADVEVHDAIGAPGGEYERERAHQEIGDLLGLGSFPALEGVADMPKHL